MKKGKLASISYYTIPEEILENREDLENWIGKSLEVKNNIKLGKIK